MPDLAEHLAAALTVQRDARERGERLWLLESLIGDESFRGVAAERLIREVGHPYLHLLDELRDAGAEEVNGSPGPQRSEGSHSERSERSELDSLTLDTLSNPAEKKFSRFTGDHLWSVSRVRGTPWPTPADVTPAVIASTKKKTKSAGLMKLVASHVLTNVNRAMNVLLYEQPELRRLSDAEVRALPSFPSYEEVEDAVLDFMYSSPLEQEWFDPEYKVEDGEIYERHTAFAYITESVMRGWKSWSPTLAWEHRDKAARGGLKGRKTAPTAIAEIAALPIDPGVEWVMERYGKSERTSYMYIERARELRRRN